MTDKEYLEDLKEELLKVVKEAASGNTLRDKAARKHLKPYNPSEWARAMGHTVMDVKEV